MSVRDGVDDLLKMEWDVLEYGRKKTETVGKDELWRRRSSWRGCKFA